jgi:ActR/RegA family two-component response regulator
MTENSEKTAKVQPRVLIVDNEERTVRMFQGFLELWGYSAIIAQGIGNTLIEDAISKAREFRCQLALIDMRLIDNFDDDDVSGLNLIEKIKPTASIIVSGYGTLQLALETVQERGARDFFEKSGDPLTLKYKLDKAADKVCASRKRWNVIPPEMLSAIAQTLFDPEIPIKYHDQVLDVLAHLFPEADYLRLEKVNSGATSSGFSTAPRPRSVVLRVYEDDLQPVIVKMARANKVTKEVDRFKKHIKGRLVGNYIPVMVDHAALWDIGGIKLSYVDSIEETFGRFMFTQPIEKIKQSLEDFFTHTWSDHYKKAKEETNVSLFSLYCNVWDRDWYKRAHNFPMPDPIKTMDETLWHKEYIRDPIAWLNKIAQNEGSKLDPSLVEKTYIAVTHGDLHTDNLLVDSTQHGWVVDFERCGEGHVLQDFIELEFDVITRMTGMKEHFPDFYHFCIAIAGARQVDEVPFDNPALTGIETQKLLNVISIIRNLAGRCTEVTDARQYLLGLFFNTIFRATIITKERQDKSQLRLWMLASILCHRLDHWDEPWPPNDWVIPS